MISPSEKLVLADLVAIANRLNVPMILVGAAARLLIFDRYFAQGRSTKDLDIAVSVSTWIDYQAFGESLVGGESPRFEKTKTPHRFKHAETDIEVDVVPFGAIGEPDQKIRWPNSEMNVLGFAEALDSARTERIDGLEIQVVDLPAFIVLKIFAWSDRGRGVRKGKDLEDLEFVLSQYRYKDDERIYDELTEELRTEAVTALDANIYLLGRDIGKILQESTRSQLNLLLDELIDRLGTEDTNALGYQLSILQQGIN